MSYSAKNPGFELNELEDQKNVFVEDKGQLSRVNLGIANTTLIQTKGKKIISIETITPNNFEIISSKLGWLG